LAGLFGCAGADKFRRAYPAQYSRKILMPLLRFIPEATNIDFVGVRYFAFAIDGLLLLISIVSIAWQGFNLGIDFTGGVLMEVKSAHVISVGTMRQEVNSLGFGESQLQYFGGGECDRPANSCVLIRVQPRQAQGQDQNAADQAVAQAIKVKLGPSYVIRSTTVVGPKVSQELFHDGVVATLLAIVMIAIYVSVRFEWQYGIGAAVATGHDVLVTAGLFSVFRLDFGLTAVAALLTLAGYSINDTVVVFDRIRENRRKYKRMKLGELINLSTNQMVTRTILTSAATAMSLFPLFIFGGQPLFDFSAPILFGIVVGTFSSIYVAAALLLYLPAPAGTIEGPAEAAS
jgi:preprotein translocase subunit SecF